ncbi:3-oxoacyl-[acyl-carrier protein] reductase [Polaribacter sp. Hel1_33_78]|jgi:3-oxoacyl-[acyl-carrier protein] reductase|uniref:SDR family oxidoreductase n=1 Tax=unclassified Polaribacter TaxID=196858 RepID=UPI00052E46B5|nr:MULTISPECIES: SDR family oxidoreductase [unclassified Polaribacter]KGL59708.1 short chain dehydrogenase/reductase [Polaribacter sp. Hel1_33_49]MBT3740944.1 SDR family oxidoreductase [Polaribacter sp.]MBT4413207.1 SDR family oxidoreductase [Polaribacter sp.]MDG1194095.1 SDR family oxidoreductase [Polaribacter sp.]MDG1404148.1 SDR family oxidoreductase [Polaribacter sp.]
MNLELKNKNALVCGSTQGIGKATAILLAEEGVNVTLIARNKEKLKKVLSELPNENQCHSYLVADFSKPNELKEILEASDLQFHILVNNTGGPAGGPIFNAKLEEFDSAFTQHLKCNHILVQSLVPFMKSQCFGRIINVISTSVKQPLDGLGVSNTIRGAVASWSKTLANELGEFGITVNNVLPGATGTARLKEIIDNKANKTGKSFDEVAEAMKNASPAKRFAKPEEVAAAIVFLSSKKASYINGINIPVDGGRTKSL